MSLILNFNDRTETVDFPAAFDDYCCLFDEICKIITEIFNLTDLQCDYLLVYYDPLYNLWINLNIHVTKRITNLIRQSSSRTLKIRIERRRKNHATTAIETNTIDNELNKRIYENRCAHITIWLDEHIGSNHWHKKLKRDCRAMINTNTNFIIDDDIDTLIQYNSRINHSESKWPSNFQYPITNCSCPFQCDLLTVDNTDTFFSYLQVTSKLARSMSIIISMHFAKETLPIILSWQQKQLLPNVLLLYVLSSNLLNDYDWAMKKNYSFV
ncbi:hypothetical protein I4U23_026582 [Adineta vaga]|nr:hypothetical protein I4U23_026582 [Adineta vaga]